MGFSSFFSSILGTRPKDTPAAQPAPRPRRDHHLAVSSTHDARPEDRGREEGSKPTTALPSALPQAAPQPAKPTREETKGERKSRRFSMVRPENQSKKRRSWFGGSPDPDEDIPAVPRLVQTSGHDRGSSRDTTVQTGTVPTTGDNAAKSASTHKTKRFSIGRVLTGGEKNSQADNLLSPRRPSFSLRRQSSSKQGRVTVETLPPLPAMPISVSQPTKPATASLPSANRRNAPSVKSIHRSNSSKRRSRGFWASSNPDDSESDVPPVPGLTRDRNPESDDADDEETPTTRLVHTMSGGEDAKQPRPLSVSSRKSYVPKAAAKGFLTSTNGASDATRMSYRKSFRIDSTADLICLTEDQRLEWSKLMNEPHRSYEQPTKTAEPVNEEEKFSNAQALAALEFGIRA
ncbi:Hypothetical predicted protein [Lecanosticta acicola]|uniref:Uncharacterized protein n=1 Tax=Lecanosticta acicola TaxID=111012 RepID=A0AAI8Z4E9_9PEZI|nr:Hypothetical predicted protein [Lecanosticta acicola]